MSDEDLSKYPQDVQESILKYLEQLGDKERIAYSIAKEHLGTSFNVVKSIGYITWKKEQSK
jgi:hypothetical protein